MHECPNQPGILARNPSLIHCIVCGYRRVPLGMEKRGGARLALGMEGSVHPVVGGLHFLTAPPLRLWPHPTGFESESHFQG